MKDLFIALLKRLPFLAILGALTVWCLSRAGTGSGGHLGVFAWMLFAFAAFIPMAILVARPIAEFLASPVDQLYMPKGEVIPPPPWYLIEKYEKEVRFAEALEEYAKVLHYHPQEYPAHEGRIQLAIHNLRDVDLARKFYLESLRTLQHPQARSDLQNLWRSLFPSSTLE